MRKLKYTHEILDNWIADISERWYPDESTDFHLGLDFLGLKLNEKDLENKLDLVLQHFEEVESFQISWLNETVEIVLCECCLLERYKERKEEAEYEKEERNSEYYSTRL